MYLEYEGRNVGQLHYEAGRTGDCVKGIALSLCPKKRNNNLSLHSGMFNEIIAMSEP